MSLEAIAAFQVRENETLEIRVYALILTLQKV